MKDLEMRIVKAGPKSNDKCPYRREVVRGGGEICLQRKEARWMPRQDATLPAWKVEEGTRSPGVMECSSRNWRRPGKGTGSLLGLLDGGRPMP